MYLEYKSLSKKGDSSTYVPKELLEMQEIGFSKLPKKISHSFDSWVAEQLQLSLDELWKYFSSEQIDSIGIIIFNFLHHKNFIIGDETGIGKGRILAGISRWAWIHNKKVLFFTEREHLISEFWKDLYHTNNISLIQNPIVFHSKSKVFNPEGIVELKGTIKKTKAIEENGFPQDTNLVLTNYSQISLKQHKKNKKNILINYCSDNIIILDESHNACGDSNTKKILIDLVNSSKHIVFSSATFMKDENQLDLYQKAIHFDSSVMEIFKSLLKNQNNNLLRKVFTYELSKNLLFLRREHQPLNISWQTIFTKNDQEIEHYIHHYAQIISTLFDILQSIKKELSEIEKVDSAWYSLGSTINRLSRNFLLILKINTLIDYVEDSIKNGRKSVIVIDSTLASLIQNILNHETDSEEDSENLEIEQNNLQFSFDKALKYIIETSIGFLIQDYQLSDSIIEQYQKLIESTKIFSVLKISPIDDIIQKLAQKNIVCEEISGRTFRINEEGFLENLKKEPKTLIVKKFNEGKVDVLIITRAGASGISLHASADFIDQKPRDLFELEITNRPNYRLQFIGRVNRKNQIHQPRFYTIITKQPFEQRIVNLEQNKLQKLQSHISGDEGKLNQENIYNFYNLFTEQSVLWFLQNNQHLAYKMGIHLNKSVTEDYYYVDSILKRCIILTLEEQNHIYDYLLYSVECFTKLHQNENYPSNVQYTKIQTFWHELDKKQQEEFKISYGKNPYLSINQFKYPWVGISDITSTYPIRIVYEKNLQTELKKNQIHQHVKIQKIQAFYKNILTKEFFYQYNTQQISNFFQNIAIGKCIRIDNGNEKIFGYIHDIILPPEGNMNSYENLILFHIKTINPEINHQISYINENFYFSFHDIFQFPFIQIYPNAINWNQFKRVKKNIEKYQLALIGHPIYLSFLQQAYQLGKTEYIQFNSKKQICVILPPNWKKEQLLGLKKPIFQSQKIMNGLISQKFSHLTTVWQKDDSIKPILKLEPFTGGYHLLVAEEIYKNNQIIDFSIKQKLKEYRGKNNGYYHFFFQYKNVRSILWSLEQKGIIWFY